MTDAGVGPADAQVPADAAEADALTGACREFSSPERTLDTMPGAIEDDLANAGADLTVVGCASENAPFGVDAPGPDHVIKLPGLTRGEYAVRLHSNDDLSFYVATGCDPALHGPDKDSCLLFVDSLVRGVEVGIFTIEQDSPVDVFIVVDHYQSDAPADTAYTLEAYRKECDTDAECGDSGKPYCVDYRCVECMNSFDCTAPSASVCSTLNNRCGPGFDRCIGDDNQSGENADDGPAGATLLDLSGETDTVNGHICNAPLSEFDYYAFDIVSGGESIALSLNWESANVDLDLQIYDSAGRLYGLSVFQRPERVDLTYLPVGRYYARVNLFSNLQTAIAIPYDISATRTASAPCSTASDCAVEYDSQFFRGECAPSGACQPIIGQGTGQTLAPCDSHGDCENQICSGFPFTADAATRSVCTLPCSTDAECGVLGAEFVCTNYLLQNHCVMRCTTSEQCPVTTAPPLQGAWNHLRCDITTGKCHL